MVEIKSGLLKDAHGRYDGMVIYHKRGKTFGRKFPSYDGNAGSPTRAHQNTRLSSVVTLYQSVKNTFLVYSWNREANNRNIASGYNLFVKENINAYDTDYNIGDFALLKFTVGDLQMPFHFRQQDAPEVSEQPEAQPAPAANMITCPKTETQVSDWTCSDCEQRAGCPAWAE